MTVSSYAVSAVGDKVGAGLESIGKGLSEIAEAIKIASVNHQPVTYNIIVNAPEGVNADEVSEHVAKVLGKGTS